MDAKPDPVDSVLSTPEVREMILKKLDVLSLVNCRLVSKAWNTTASSVLGKRPVWIKRRWDSGTFGRLYKCVKLSGSLSTNFPFRGLDLSSIGSPSGNRDFKYATKLFTKFGWIFTHLRAKCWVWWHTVMIRNLLKKTAQQEYLELGGLQHSDWDTEVAGFCLSSLHTLKFSGLCGQGDEPVLGHLIRAAPHLKEIRNVRYSSAAQMAALRDARKFHLVSSMIISHFTEARVCSELIANPPKLTALSVEINGPTTLTRHFLVTLRSLLVQNASTLTRLKFCRFPEQLDELPVFQRLEELVFEMNTDHYASMSAIVSRLSSSSFPKLKKIRLDTKKAEISEKTISDYFWGDCETPLESVDTLELDSHCGQDVIKYLAKCFPQVTYIAINYKQGKYGSGQRKGSNIWLLRHFPNLSKLDIRCLPFKYGIMDSLLTGMPPETVAKLRKAQKQSLTRCISGILRTDGNILQLKNLREFTVTVMPSSSVYNPTKKNPFMTMVSIWYALELVPGLRANFLCCSKDLKSSVNHSADFQKAFEPVKDCVTVGQCFCDEEED